MLLPGERIEVTLDFGELPLLLTVRSLPFVTSRHYEVSPEAIYFSNFSSFLLACYLVTKKLTDKGSRRCPRRLLFCYGDHKLY